MDFFRNLKIKTEVFSPAAERIYITDFERYLIDNKYLTATISKKYLKFYVFLKLTPTPTAPAPVWQHTLAESGL